MARGRFIPVELGLTHPVATNGGRLWASAVTRTPKTCSSPRINAGAGGKQPVRTRASKAKLQNFAVDSRLRIRVSRCPPGTSRWNESEHRLFCHSPNAQILGRFVPQASEFTHRTSQPVGHQFDREGFVHPEAPDHSRDRDGGVPPRIRDGVEPRPLGIRAHAIAACELACRNRGSLLRLT